MGGYRKALGVLGGVRSELLDGLGLGLFIVHQIVTAHQGRIAVHSADGTTRFRVELPRISRA